MSSQERALIEAALALYRQGSRLDSCRLVAEAKVIDAFADAAALAGDKGE